MRFARVGRSIPRGRSGQLLWLALLVAAGTWFVWSAGVPVGESARAIRTATPGWLALAVAAQLAIQCLIALNHRAVLGRLGGRFPYVFLIQAHLRRFFVSTVIPCGGTLGHASFARDLNRHGMSGPTGVYGSVLGKIAEDIGSAFFLFPAIVALALWDGLTLPIAGAAAALVAGLASGPFLLALAVRSGRIERWIARFAPDRLLAALDEARGHQIGPRDLLRVAPYPFGVNLCGLAMMTAAVYATGERPGPGAILAARIAASAGPMVMPLFQGAGVVEVGVAGALHAGGMPLPAAVAAALIFRTAQFWLPLTAGAITHLLPLQTRAAEPSTIGAAVATALTTPSASAPPPLLGPSLP